jgi:hypothetical protein
MVSLLIGTKKGAFIFDLSENRQKATPREPILFGQIIYHMVSDPRNPKTILMAAKTGHLGPTIFRSEDGGKSWKEASQPPKFEENANKSVDFVFWITPGHKSKPNQWFASTSPQYLFVSNDNGDTWIPVDKFNKHPLIAELIKDNQGTPAGPLLHSINISSEDPNHMAVALSSGGVFETKDGGENWIAMNKNVLADFLPEPYPEVGHCVHNFQMHLANPKLWYQQNHCGVYRIDTENEIEWTRIGENIPKEIGDIGFSLIVHPTDINKIWVTPMDGTSVWPRTSIDGKPAFYHSADGGQTWIRQDNGFPKENAWFTILRQAACHDFQEPLGLYFGNKAGEIWYSIDEGSSWKLMHKNLPEVYSVEIML